MSKLSINFVVNEKMKDGLVNFCYSYKPPFKPQDVGIPVLSIHPGSVISNCWVECNSDTYEVFRRRMGYHGIGE